MGKIEAYAICHVCKKRVDYTERVVMGHPDLGAYSAHEGSCADQLRVEMPFLYEAYEPTADTAVIMAQPYRK